MKKINSFDLNKLYIIFLILVVFSSYNLLSAQEMIFSEIMFAPSESNSEFIEIYNPSEYNSVNLFGSQIKYHTASSDEIISQTEEYELNPNQYAIIFEADYDFENGVYKDLIDEDVLVFILDDNAFGSTGMANTSDRTVYLINSSDDTLDVYTYSANNDIGYSDERKELAENIWENSKVFNGTPGKKNSVAPVQYDLAITEFYASEPYSIIGNTSSYYLKIKNVGSESAQNFSVGVYFDQNRDNQAQLEELIFNETYLELSTNDSLLISNEVNDIADGVNVFYAEIEYVEDEFLNNNLDSIKIKGIEINEVWGDLIINEFMYAPKSPEPEWFEIYNRSEKIININKYQFADNSDTVFIVNNDIYLNPKDYIVFTDDSSITNIYPSIQQLVITSLPTLNNSGDGLFIMDSLNRVIDSLIYTSDFGGKNGNSVERIDPLKSSEDLNNWIECVMPTPGFINSVSQKDFDLVIDTVFTNPKFPLIGTKAKFITKVLNVGKNLMDFSIEIYEDANKDSLADNLLEVSNLMNIAIGDSVNFEFKYEADNVAAGSNYILKLNVEDDDSTNNNFFVELLPTYPLNSIEINEIMYSPINFEPEWVELYNNSEYDINIYNWSIGDVMTNPVFKSISENVIFPKFSFLVITKNNTIYNFHRSINSTVVEIPFANLNNDEDGIVLKDNNKRTIDSLIYLNDWGGTMGRSLERINVDYLSSNSNNWNSSIDLEGSTPGRINSITPKEYDLSIKALSTIPRFPVEGDNVIISVQIQNYGNIDAENFEIDFYIGDFSNNLILDNQNNLFLSAGDSIILSSSESVLINDTMKICANVTFNLDQDKLNNYVEKNIIPGFNARTVLINEIMFKPDSGEPEWIEIFNNSDSVVNFCNWKIGDLSSTNIITQDKILLPPNEFLILCDSYNESYFDSEVIVLQTDLPNLSNTKDAVVIYDFRDAVIDSTHYNVPSDFNIGTSLERESLALSSTEISNWTFSLDSNKCTPGKENSISILPDYLFDDVIITEIMFDPSDTNSEFLEILNTSGKQIEIGGWKIEDDSGDYNNIMKKSLILDPGELFVIAADSSVLQNYIWLEDIDNLSILNLSSLNFTNTGKQLYLIDIKGNTIDSIYYSSSWHNSALLETKNISLELINEDLSRTRSNNWSSSVSELGATPGRENSINVENLISNAKLEITPNPFSPDNDGFEDVTFINFNLTQPVSQIRARIFDSKGRFIRSLANNQLTGSQGTVIFDGLDSSKNPLKMGIYIILFEAVNSNNAVIDVIKDVIVVARKL